MSNLCALSKTTSHRRFSPPLRISRDTRALVRVLLGGATFTQYYVTNPVCCPSRISLLSGRFSHNTLAVSTLASGW